MMFTDEGKFWIALILFLFGIWISGYFIGWSRNKLAGKIFDKMLDYLHKARYWEGRYEETRDSYFDLIDKYKELKTYTLGQVGAEHVPTKFGGELE